MVSVAGDALGGAWVVAGVVGVVGTRLVWVVLVGVAEVMAAELSWLPQPTSDIVSTAVSVNPFRAMEAGRPGSGGILTAITRSSLPGRHARSPSTGISPDVSR